MWAQTQADRQNLGVPRLRLCGSPRSALARSICIVMLSVRMWSFLVPSRISVLAKPGQGVAGQTRPNVVSANKRLNHCSRSRSPRRRATPLGPPADHGDGSVTVTNRFGLRLLHTEVELQLPITIILWMRGYHA